MARPKNVKSKPVAKPEQKTIAFRTSAEYAAWVDRLAGHNRTTIAGLLDQALVEFARIKGFDEKAPER
jgi:hypothetical protein